MSRRCVPSPWTDARDDRKRADQTRVANPVDAKRIVLTTWGSFGDLHPYIATAIELKRRGHRPSIATSHYYRTKIEAEGIDFHPLRPDLPPLEDAPEVLRRTLDGRAGARFMFENLLMPHLRDAYADLEAATRNADLIVTHPLSFAGRLLAEKTRMPWVSSVLAPISFFSAYDPPLIDEAMQFGARQLNKIIRLHPGVARFLIEAGKFTTRSWIKEVVRLRRELGLPPGDNPMFDGQHSPRRVLALYSEIFAPAQPDFPAQTCVTGFCFYDRRDYAGDDAMSPTLLRFLDDGEPPVVFTLGSSAVWIADDFYRMSVEAVNRIGRRAVLLIGDERNLPPAPLPSNVLAVPYAPYSELLPRAAAVVHSGGIGSVGQTLRAGVPALIVPFAYDQPDNAHRVERLGCGRTIDRRSYTAPRVADELHALITGDAYRSRAAEVGRAIRAENGQARACDYIEEVLGITIAHTTNR